MSSTHKPRILFLYGSLRDRSYSRLLAEAKSFGDGKSAPKTFLREKRRELLLNLVQKRGFLTHTNYLYKAV